MGVDYVNQYAILKPLLDGNTKNYNFPAAKKYLQQRIQEYIKDVNDNTYKELTILRNQLDQLEKIATTLDPEDIPSIAAIEEEITALSANIAKRQNLLEVWRKAGRPKNLNFDQGQDYIKGMSYGINGWNPTGEGYTTGEAVLDSVFQLQKDLEVPIAPRPQQAPPQQAPRVTPELEQLKEQAKQIENDIFRLESTPAEMIGMSISEIEQATNAAQVQLKQVTNQIADIEKSLQVQPRTLRPEEEWQEATEELLGDPEVIVPETRASAVDVDELKFVEELIDDAKEYNYNYDMTPQDLDNFIKALDNTSTSSAMIK